MNSKKNLSISAIVVLVIALTFSINAFAVSYDRTATAVPLPQNTETSISLQSQTNTHGSADYANTAFNASYGQGLANDLQAQTAFNKALDNWSYYLKDPILINLDLDYRSLGTGILGQTGTSGVVGDYDTLRNMLITNAGQTNTPRQNALLPLLPTSSQFSAYLPDGFSMDSEMFMTMANYHALGGTQFTDNVAASITFSSNFAWDFDPSDGIDSGKFDFIGVATHEIGHALGFISEVDYVDIILNNSQVATDVRPTAFDLFRFHAPDVTDPDFDFTTTPRDLEPGFDDVFYYGDGTIELASGAHNGDGRQASHFKDLLELGIMDPTAASGELLTITQNDLIVLEMLGWDIADFTTVPEPATAAFLLIGAAIAIRKSRIKTHS